MLEKLEVRPDGRKSRLFEILELAYRAGDDPPDILALSHKDGRYLSGLERRYRARLRREAKLEGPPRFYA